MTEVLKAYVIDVLEHSLKSMKRSGSYAVDLIADYLKHNNALRLSDLSEGQCAELKAALVEAPQMGRKHTRDKLGCLDPFSDRVEFMSGEDLAQCREMVRDLISVDILAQRNMTRLSEFFDKVGIVKLPEVHADKVDEFKSDLREIWKLRDVPDIDAHEQTIDQCQKTDSEPMGVKVVISYETPRSSASYSVLVTDVEAVIKVVEARVFELVQSLSKKEALDEPRASVDPFADTADAPRRHRGRPKLVEAE